VAAFKKSQSIDFPMKTMHVVCSAICLFDYLQCFCFFCDCLYLTVFEWLLSLPWILDFF